MHSKFLVIDGRITFITSANFSKAGADRNLETGVLIRGEQIASQIKDHIDNLRSSGELVVWSPK
jgi:phosphatidylserine/phosphatidylglycerophosphate/cardiolipin synthase-like enzyme